MWQTVELRELRLFRTLSEEQHFGRTAERLQLTTSRVSQSLRVLEQKLGAKLFHRTSRRVRLTEFGAQFLSEVGPALDRLDGVLERAGAATRSVEGTLRLGLFSAPAGGPHLVEIIRAFEALHPSASVAVIQMSWDDPFQRLREGEVDLMASWLPVDRPDLVVGPVLTVQPRALAMAPDHPLATRTTVDVEELADYRLLHFDTWPKEFHEAIAPSRTPRGRPIPRLRVPVGERSVADISMRIARGDVVHPTAASAASFLGDLAYVPITGMTELRSAFLWRRPARDPKLRAFIRVAREFLRSSSA